MLSFIWQVAAALACTAEDVFALTPQEVWDAPVDCLQEVAGLEDEVVTEEMVDNVAYAAGHASHSDKRLPGEVAEDVLDDERVLSVVNVLESGTSGLGLEEGANIRLAKLFAKGRG